MGKGTILLYSNSLGIPNLGDNLNYNTNLFDTSYWIYHQLFKSNSNLQVLIIKSLNESFLLKCLTQN